MRNMMIPTRIGQQLEGGYFSGVIRIRDRAYAILVAPKSTEGSVQFKTTYSSTPNIQLVNDGWANTNAMNDNSHLAAQHCRSLTVGGHADLYLPSRDELEMCYRVFKPTNQDNVTYTAGTFIGNSWLGTGTNLNTIPTGAAYTVTNPTRTIVTSFQTGSVEAFDLDWYWASTEASSDTYTSLIQDFSDGDQDWNYKPNVNKVRSVRRVPILIDKE